MPQNHFSLFAHQPLVQHQALYPELPRFQSPDLPSCRVSFSVKWEGRMLMRSCSECCVLPGACRVGRCGAAGLREWGGMRDVSPIPRHGKGLGQHQGMTMC